MTGSLVRHLPPKRSGVWAAASCKRHRCPRAPLPAQQLSTLRAVRGPPSDRWWFRALSPDREQSPAPQAAPERGGPRSKERHLPGPRAGSLRSPAPSCVLYLLTDEHRPEGIEHNVPVQPGKRIRAQENRNTVANRKADREKANPGDGG